jgi:hypothetical protein
MPPAEQHPGALFGQEAASEQKPDDPGAEHLLQRAQGRLRQRAEFPAGAKEPVGQMDF